MRCASARRSAARRASACVPAEPCWPGCCAELLGGAHVVQRLIEAVERLLQLLLVLLILLALLAAALLAALLAGLSRLAGSARIGSDCCPDDDCDCWPCCPCWPCWPCCCNCSICLRSSSASRRSISCCQRCSKDCCLLLVLLLRQFFLAAREIAQALQGFVGFFLALFGGVAAALAGLVLILFAIEFEIEHAGQIAAGVLPAASATTAAKGDLNVTEGGFGAQQMLQGALLGAERVLPVLSLSFSDAGSISAAAASRSLTKFWNS